MVFFGRSQFGLLHFGHTRGFSSRSRGNHSWPHRQRQARNRTIPISGSFTFGIASPLPIFTNGIYFRSCQSNLLMVYTIGKGEVACTIGRRSLGNGWAWRLPPLASSRKKAQYGWCRRNPVVSDTRFVPIRRTPIAPVPITSRL